MVQNTRNLHRAVNTDVAQVQARRQTIASSQSALEATQIGYQVGTRNIVDALSRTPGRTFLCANAVGYYGDGGDAVLTEDAPRGSGFLADVASAWEAEALNAGSFGHRVVTPRISVVLGNGGALAKMHLPFSLGLGGRLGSGRQWFPWIHVRDLVRVMSFLLETPAARGAFNACSPEAVTNAGFTAALARALKRPAFLPVPPFALRLVEKKLLELGGRPVLRLGKMKDGPVITDNGNFVLDVDFGRIEEPVELGARMSRIPGLVEHGIFENLDELFLARGSGLERIRREK